MIEWGECLNEFIKEVEVDKYRTKSIIEMALNRQEIIKKLKVDKKTVSFVIEGYYEVIKELLVAYLLSHGLRSKNHQCLISYFYKKNPEREGEVKLISRMLYYRNRLNYYGESIPLSFYENNDSEIFKLIKLIKELVHLNKKKR